MTSEWKGTRGRLFYNPECMRPTVLYEDNPTLLRQVSVAEAHYVDALGMPGALANRDLLMAAWNAVQAITPPEGDPVRVAEAANVAKKMLRHRDAVAGNRGEDMDLEALRRKLGRELADVVIYADLVAASQGIDLGEAVRETFNAKSEEIGAEERL